MAICHVTLATSDIDRTRDFFEKALGWRRSTDPATSRCGRPGSRWRRRWNFT